ncbi:glycosyltransferase family 4 protein [Thalassospira xiamenensis]|uniref:Glycosyl transferase n=1 Tax=Thalassospira xiamenensis TaxID=220697 RepID=A0A367X4B3_9PROT|nr:glycosyltransferase family 4 protein [Thalassospira xiamenensis]KZB54391.1 glycosyl transferase [Thalassospira xiamenensis]MCK2165650.1 glycosyltransferase family 4 protein [Thalassospira xiamenensis]RCK48513.1 glycosyl transferase [Thalassospira xiamenensis]
MNPRIMVLAHNHPDLHPGGTEIFAHDLFNAYKRAGCEAIFVGATNDIHRERRPGTSFQAINDAGDEMLFWAGHFDRFNMSQTDLYAVAPNFTELLKTWDPDVVHIHHLVLWGIELPMLIRRVLPHCQIVMTLHDYYPICPNDGLMIHRGTRQRYLEADRIGKRCGLDGIAPDRFSMRSVNLRNHLRVVDRFLSPSAFLRDRYIDWGINPEKIEVMHNGRPPVPAAPKRDMGTGMPNVFGYFGNLNPWKGADVLLEASQKLAADDVDFELRVHGAAPFQTVAFNEKIDGLFEVAGSKIHRMGAYERADIPELMSRVDWVVVPSIWWENAPLVIQEAFQHGRPVITSGIGGMAEMVRDGHDGIHVRADDPADLARVMKDCATNPKLWKKLSGHVRPPAAIDDVAQKHLVLFRKMIRPDFVAA